MTNILVTGFTGNVGQEVAKALRIKNSPFKCAVRNVEKSKVKFGLDYDYVRFDLSNPDTFEQALENIDKIFLIYPPELSGPEALHPFFEKVKEKGIKHIVYLSIKDVQFLPFIPHHKNEKAIKAAKLPYTFLRAGYFMQNLNMFLLNELKENGRIFVPAGKGKTSFIDVRDIAEVAVLALLGGTQHVNKSYCLTGKEAIDFDEVAKRMSSILGKKITYTNPNARDFQQYMLQKGVDPGFIKVVTNLHFITKIGLAKGMTNDYVELMKKNPTAIDTYIQDYREYWV